MDYLTILTTNTEMYLFAFAILGSVIYIEPYCILYGIYLLSLHYTSYFNSQIYTNTIAIILMSLIYWGLYIHNMSSNIVVSIGLITILFWIVIANLYTQNEIYGLRNVLFSCLIGLLVGLVSYIISALIITRLAKYYGYFKSIFGQEQTQTQQMPQIGSTILFGISLATSTVITLLILVFIKSRFANQIMII